MRKGCFTAALVAAILWASSSQAQEASDDPRDIMIHQLLKRIEQLELRVGYLTGEVQTLSNERQTPQPEEAPVTTAPATPPPATTAAQQQASPSPPQPEQVPESPGIDVTADVRDDLRALEEALVRANALLLPAWSAEVEPSLTYAHTSNDFISIDGFALLPVLVIGEILSERVKRDTLIGTFTGRIGLPWDTQADIRVPFRYDTLERVRSDGTVTEESIHGLGDIQLGLSAHVLRERGPWPDVLLRAEWKPATGKDPFASANELALGTGFDAYRGSVTLVKAVDPAVLVGSVSYTHTVADSKSIGKVDTGDSLTFSIGAAVALSSDVSVNFAWEQQFTEETDVDGTSIPGSSFNIGTFQFGTTYALTQDVALDFDVAIGLTEDSNDVEVTMAVPIRVW